MNRSLALFFAVVGTLLLAAISYFISIGQLWFVLLFSVLSIGFIGFGFITKAKIRKKQDH